MSCKLTEFRWWYFLSPRGGCWTEKKLWQVSTFGPQTLTLRMRWEKNCRPFFVSIHQRDLLVVKVLMAMNKTLSYDQIPLLNFLWNSTRCSRRRRRKVRWLWGTLLFTRWWIKRFFYCCARRQNFSFFIHISTAPSVIIAIIWSVSLIRRPRVDCSRNTWYCFFLSEASLTQ